MKTHDLDWLMKNHPRAFEALPEPYQADSCLEFWEQDGDIFARPSENQIEVLGDWVQIFSDFRWFPYERF